jgi:hypothetical protein
MVFAACGTDVLLRAPRSTGKERDAESGNDYFGARSTQVQWAVSYRRIGQPKLAPVPYAKLDDPQSLNLYAYVRNNPLSDYIVGLSGEQVTEMGWTRAERWPGSIRTCMRWAR